MMYVDTPHFYGAMISLHLAVWPRPRPLMFVDISNILYTVTLILPFDSLSDFSDR